jgi:type IV pilus assembly protein PilB
VLAQRLVRLICPACKERYQPTDQELVDSALDPAQYRDRVYYSGRGCIECHGTGYRGREAISELLDLSDEIRELILARKPAAQIRRQAEAEGMSSLRHSALQKVADGVTTLREINKVTFVQ